MRRCVFFMLLLAIFFLCSCMCAGERLSDYSLQQFMAQANPFLQNLDTNLDPIVVMNYCGKYDAKIESGETVTLIEHSAGSLPLYQDENARISERIQLDASKFLQAVQICIQGKDFINLHNDPYAVRPYQILLELSEERIQSLFGSGRIVRVCISIHTRNEEGEQAIHVQRQHLVPDGLVIDVFREDETIESYLYGPAYDYSLSFSDSSVLVTISNEKVKNVFL